MGVRSSARGQSASSAQSAEDLNSYRIAQQQFDTAAQYVADLPDGLAKLLWSYAPEERRPRPATRADVPATTPESIAMAKDLKRRGFKFVGPTTAYALMQATGMVDDHLAGCFVPPVRP